MVCGAVAFLGYAYIAGQLLKRTRARALAVTLTAFPIWFGLSFGFLLLVRGVS